MENNIVQQIKTIKWKEWGSRRLTIRIAEHWTKCSIMFNKFFNTDFPDQLILIKDEVGSCYLGKVKLDDCLRSILRDLYNSSFYDIYEREAIKEFEEFLSYCKDIANLQLKGYSNEKLIELFNEFVIKEDCFTNYLWIIFIIDESFSKELEHKLKEYLNEKKNIIQFDEFLKVLIFPEKKSAIFLQTLDILDTAKDIRNGTIKGEEIKERIKELVNRYSYFPILNFDEEPLDFDHFKNEINKILKNKEVDPKTEIERINKQFKENNEKYKKVIKFLEDDKELVKLAEACHKIAYYRDYRNDVRRESYFYAKGLYLEIAKRFKLDMTNLLFLTREEIIESLKREELSVSIDAVKKRRKSSAIALINNKIHFIFSSKDISDLFKFLEPQINVEEFQGIAVSPGKVTGKAKIIFNAEKESGKLKKGDILVTSMTNLDFVPLMSKASAIVTNEGGLLCHAAIIAREMRKPCIVGTSIATKVLKDGDIIEVNANHGLVKIVKRK